MTYTRSRSAEDVTDVLHEQHQVEVVGGAPLELGNQVEVERALTEAVWWRPLVGPAAEVAQVVLGGEKLRGR